jgi:Mitochondrial carrier protein
VFATKRVFDWASRYYFADLFEDIFRMVKGAGLSVSEQSIASLLGGVASTCLTLPLDVLVAKTQDAKKAGVKVSALTMFMDELREKGAKGLSDAYLRGFAARLLHVCLTTVGTFTPF